MPGDPIAKIKEDEPIVTGIPIIDAKLEEKRRAKYETFRSCAIVAAILLGLSIPMVLAIGVMIAMDNFTNKPLGDTFTVFALFSTINIAALFLLFYGWKLMSRKMLVCFLILNASWLLFISIYMIVEPNVAARACLRLLPQNPSTFHKVS